MAIKTLRARIWMWKRLAEARYCGASLGLFFAKLRYHFLCFKHFGWRRAVAYLLETPQHISAVGLALFTHRGHSKDSTPPAGHPR